MRFRKSVNLGKGVKLNISKSGVSTTVGGKGSSLNIGRKGTYLNTGIPGTGLYDRTQIGGNKKTGGNTNMGGSWIANETGGYIAINTNEMDIEENPYIPPCPKNNPIVHLLLLCFTVGIGNLLYYGHVKNKQYQWKKMVNRHNILEPKLKAIKNHELFDSAKVFIIDLNNIIAFSEKGYIALWTDKYIDEMKVFEASSIQKINQEIKSGDCFAHFYTDDFNDNVVSLLLGDSSSKEETENIRKLYNEIKGLYTTLKKQK